MEGKRVPSVTTILSRFKDSGGLIHWAWNEGHEGRDYRDTKQKAADAGTLAHDMVECAIRGRKYKRPAGVDFKVETNAKHAFAAFQEWKRRVKLTVTHSELPLVSLKHHFGGCLDAMLVMGKLILGDWKTSNAVYTDMLIQVAGGYSLLWEENHPLKPIEGIEILRFSKPQEPGDPISFTDHFWGPEVIKPAQRQFLLLREAYDLDKRLKSLL